MDSASAKETVKGLLKKEISVEVADGRIMTGELYCFDKNGNIILTNATEYRSIKGKTESRGMGHAPVLIPPEQRINVTVVSDTAAALGIPQGSSSS